MFDPTLPADAAKIKAPELRSQFNGLKAIIDSQSALITSQSALIAGQNALISGLNTRCDNLQAQIDALAPHGLAASGFGDSRANGTLTEVAPRFGQPAYQISGGGMIISLGGTSAWELWEADPNGQMFTALYRSNGPALTDTWYVVTGAVPAGSIA